MGKQWRQCQTLFSWAPKSLQMVTAAMKLKDAYSLEKEMATHSSFLAWKIPWTVEPGRLQSMGLQRVRHDWATSLSLSLYSLERFMTNLDSILKSRDITVPTKVRLVKARSMLWSMVSQRVGHDWATELNWTSSQVTLMCWSWIVLRTTALEKLHIGTRRHGQGRSM